MLFHHHLSFPFSISHSHFLTVAMELISPTPARLGSGKPSYRL